MSVLNAEPREAHKKGALNQLRRKGILPMAIIEKGKGTVAIQAPAKEVVTVLRQAHRQFQIQLTGEAKPRDVILTKVEKDPLATHLIHVSVMQVSDTDVITVDVPIIVHGTPDPVAKHEASILHPTTSIRVRGQVKNIPENVEVDVSALEIGGSISVGDIHLAEGLDILTASDATVATVKVLRQVEAEEAPAEAAEGVEPEIVGAEDKEKEEE